MPPSASVVAATVSSGVDSGVSAVTTASTTVSVGASVSVPASVSGSEDAARLVVFFVVFFLVVFFAVDFLVVFFAVDFFVVFLATVFLVVFFAADFFVVFFFVVDFFVVFPAPAEDSAVVGSAAGESPASESLSFMVMVVSMTAFEVVIECRRGDVEPDRDPTHVGRASSVGLDLDRIPVHHTGAGGPHRGRQPRNRSGPPQCGADRSSFRFEIIQFEAGPVFTGVSVGDPGQSSSSA